MTAKRALLLSFAWLLGSGATQGASGPQGRVLQPVENRQGVLLSVHDRRLDVELPSGPRTVSRLREGEVLSTVAETREGWVAAGGHARDPGVELTILAGSDRGARRLPSPGGGRRPLELRPTLLVERGALVGAAWLEGDDVRSLRVRAAAWSGTGWAEPETVAGPAAGSQTGLAGTVLDDGSWLLVWAANDGRDDELVWSRRQGAEWSPVRALHPGNEAPDVTPALIAEAGGALVAWSRLEAGEYVLLLARLTRDGWSQPRAVGPPGSLFPSFTRPGDRPLLLYRTAAERGWAAYELDQGQPELLAAIPSADGERPAVVPDGRDGLRFRWAEDAAGKRVSWEPMR